MTIALGFAAVNTGNNLLFLIVSALLAFMMVTGVIGMFNVKGLDIRVTPPEEIFAGSPAVFRLSLLNTKPRASSFLIRLSRHNAKPVLIPVIPAKESASAAMTFTFPRRGEARMESLTISSSFPVNFFARSWTIPLDTSFVVFPRLLPGLAGDNDQGTERSGNNARMARGLDGELERIRRYSGRESLKMIHWKLSARSAELMVKEFGRRAMNPLIIDPDKQPGHTLEDRLSISAWLVKKWVLRRPVGLVLPSRSIPGAMGRAQAVVLLTELALYDRN